MCSVCYVGNTNWRQNGGLESFSRKATTTVQGKIINYSKNLYSGEQNVTNVFCCKMWKRVNIYRLFTDYLQLNRFHFKWQGCFMKGSINTWVSLDTTHLSKFLVLLYYQLVMEQVRCSYDNKSHTHLDVYHKRGKIRWAKHSWFQPYEVFRGNNFAVHWPPVFIVYLQLKIHRKTFAVLSKTVKV